MAPQLAERFGTKLVVTSGLTLMGAGFLIAALYSTQVAERFTGTALPAEAVAAAKESVGAAYIMSERAAAVAGPAAGQFVREVAAQAFVNGLTLTSRVLAGVAFAGAVAALALLPARAARGEEAVVIDLDAPDLDLGLTPALVTAH